MEIGGQKTRYLFADMLGNKEHIVETAGVKHIECKNGKKAPFLVVLGNIEGNAGEYLVSIYRIVSDVKFDPELPRTYKISRRNENIFFSP